jgi:hypothetical protein
MLPEAAVARPVHFNHPPNSRRQFLRFAGELVAKLLELVNAFLDGGEMLVGERQHVVARRYKLRPSMVRRPASFRPSAPSSDPSVADEADLLKQLRGLKKEARQLKSRIEGQLSDESTRKGKGR